MSCVFCDIVAGKIRAKILGENERAIAFLDVKPISDGHAIIITKKHYRDFNSCPKDDLLDVIKLAQEISQTINDSKLKPWGFNYLINEGNIAGQEIMHFHIHVIPKYAKHEGLKLLVGKQHLDLVDHVFEQITDAKKRTKSS
jgi:histidine triad (HIT) family protein